MPIPNLPLEAWIIVGVALAFDYLNGLHDSSNVVATVISSRAIGPRRALIIAAIAEFSGPLIFGVAVATTIGHEVVVAEVLTPVVILSALIGAITWNVITWFFGIPSSSSHALVGGLLGAVIAAQGTEAVKLSGVEKVLLSLFISPPLGALAGYLLMRLILFLARGATPHLNIWLKRGQILTAVTLALSHGANDAQKSMGMITLGLVVTGAMSEFHVPTWVVLACASAIALGTLSGGWRLIRTLGGKFYKIRPIHGFGAQTASSAVILGAALLGGPVSTTQVVSSAIVGVGSAERLSKVRWNVASRIITAWVLTIPSSGIVGAIMYWLLSNYTSFG